MNTNINSTAEGKSDAIIIQLLAEMREQRSAYREEQLLAARERRSVHRWNLALKSVLIVGPLAGAAMYFATATGFSFGPFGDVIGVVEIKGEIKDGALASADKIVPALEAAFKSSHVKKLY